MPTRSQKNTFLAGILVIFAILASVAIIIVLSGVFDTVGTRTYTVRFDLTTNIGGLQPGAQVRVGGHRVGVVNAVEFARPDDTAIDGIDITIRVDRDVELREDAVAFLELPLLGTQGVINFFTIGEGAPLAEGGEIVGTLAPPSFLAQAGFGEEERGKVRTIIDNINGFSARLDPIGEDASTLVEDAKAVVADIRASWDERWEARIDRVTENLDTTVARGPDLADDIERRLEALGDALATAQAYLDDNRDSVDQIIENVREASGDVRSFSERLDTELSDKFIELLETGKTELTKAGDAVKKYGDILDEQRPNLRKTLANFRLASDQLRDTLVEVRRSPWRLLYRPDTRELEYELLYDAARTYAAALSDLRAASESLQEVQGAPRAPTPERIDDLLQRLDEAFEGYRQAEDLFIERIGEEARRVGG